MSSSADEALKRPLPRLDADPLPTVLISLMRGVSYREEEPARWQALLDLQGRVRDYVSLLGVELVVDESEGYAYLRQRTLREGEPDLPRLIPRRPLTFQVSLLLALLRKKLSELDAGSSETRLILARSEIVDLMRLFSPDLANEARLVDRIDAHINKVVELGFLRRLKGEDDRFEVRRILKAFVDAQWLHELDQRLAEYQTSLAGGGGAGE